MDKMTTHTQMFNNFFMKKSKEKHVEKKVDIISKIFAVLGICLGLNRLCIVCLKDKKLYIALLGCYSLLFYFLIVYRVWYEFQFHILYILLLPDAIQCVLCAAMSFIFRERLNNFYRELSSFDEENRFSQKVSVQSVYNLVQLVITFLFSVAFSSFPENSGPVILKLVHLYAAKLLHLVEIHYFGHLISLLIPRLKLLSDNLTLFCPYKHSREYSVEFDNRNELTNYTKTGEAIGLDKLMDSYGKIIEIYDILYEAIKWQMFALITASFTVTCVNIYSLIIAATQKHDHYLQFIAVNISFILLEVAPLVLPCFFADQINAEAFRLRTLISSRLYENTFDKPSGRTARALLVLMKTRSLNFSVFRMFNVDTSLPLKLMALLLVYVVILLQLDKYITPIGTL